MFCSAEGCEGRCLLVCLIITALQEFVARYNERMQAMHKRGAEMISTYEELLVSSNDFYLLWGAGCGDVIGRWM